MSDPDIIDFDKSLKEILSLEGGYSDRPLDLGGPTNKGITQNEFNIFNETHGKPRRDVQTITDDEVRLIYELDFWDRSGCDQLCSMGKDKVAYILFNIAVQRGFARAVCMLQAIVSIVPQTGHFGQVTNHSCSVANENSLVFSLLSSMQNHYNDEVKKMPDQVANLNGWLNRLDLMAGTVGSPWRATRPA